MHVFYSLVYTRAHLITMLIFLESSLKGIFHPKMKICTNLLTLMSLQTPKTCKYNIFVINVINFYQSIES